MVLFVVKIARWKKNFKCVIICVTTKILLRDKNNKLDEYYEVHMRVSSPKQAQTEIIAEKEID